MQINWQNVLIRDHMNNALRILALGQVSISSSSDLFEINNTEHYHIRILGWVLDQIYDIPVDPNLPNPQHQQIRVGAMASSVPPDYTPPYEI